jgi:nickel/cobalt transporter (NicO) family protein
MSVYLSAIMIGLLHGIEPGHGWPVAVLYSLKRERRTWFGLVTSGILAFFHLLSSLAVVVVFLLVNRAVDLSSLPFIRYGVVLLLLYMAYRAYAAGHDHGHEHGHTHHDHPHDHPHSPSPYGAKRLESLWDMAVFAFLLGFIHEEEFALLALCLGGIHCVALMLTYALAVSVALIGVTLLAIQGYHLVEDRLKKYQDYIPKALAGLFALMAVLYLFRAL